MLFGSLIQELNRGRCGSGFVLKDPSGFKVWMVEGVVGIMSRAYLMYLRSEILDRDMCPYKNPEHVSNPETKW